jgi:hypothetical protein
VNPRNGFAGDLQALSVAELIQTIALGGRTARVTVDAGARRGEIWFHSGALVHAEAPPLYGEPAAYAMLAWTSGSFSVTYGVTTEARSIEQDATYVVLEGLRRVDERGQEAATGVPPLPSRERAARRPLLQIVGTAAVMAAIGVALLVTSGEGVSTPAAGDVETLAPVPAAAPAVPAPAPPDPVPVAPRRKSPAPVPAPEPAPVVVSPEPSIEPAPAEPEPPAPVVAPETPPPASTLRVRVKSGVVSGSLAILVDGAEVFARPLERRRDAFAVDVPVPPGDHEIVARVVDPEHGGASEKAVRGTFVADAGQTLRITAGRRFGAPVKVKLTEGSGDDDGE